VPRHDVALGFDAQMSEKLSAQFTLQHIAGIEPSSFAPAANKVGDHTLVHVNTAYQVNESVEAFLRVENLFDEDYETAGGFNTSGRAAYAGLRASF
jgi:vitamin B12 transporter